MYANTFEDIMVGDSSVGFFGHDTMPESVPGTLRELRGYDFIDAELLAALPDTEDAWDSVEHVRDLTLYARYYLPFSRCEWYITSKSLREDGALILAGYALVSHREWGVDLGMWDAERIEIPFDDVLSVTVEVWGSDGEPVVESPVRVVERDFGWVPMTAREAGMPTFGDEGFRFENELGAEVTNVEVTWEPQVRWGETVSERPRIAPAKPQSKGARKKAAQRVRQGRAA